jgi:phage shock protein PspC (stress-responsive transcriptional regulator)
MKKNFSVNIYGRLFHIDEDAHQLLEEYFEYLRIEFGEEVNSESILEDFQKRISNSLWEQTKNSEFRIVSLVHVEKVLASLGYFSKNHEANNGEADSQNIKRLYRDSENRLIGGVCAGISAYLGVDVLVIRILFAVFTLVFAVGLLIYLVLWVVVPVAHSPIDKLNMKGEKINTDKVKDILKNEYKEIEKQFQQFKNSSEADRIEENLKDFFRASVVLRFIFGGLLMAVSLFVIIGLVYLLIMPFSSIMLPGVEIRGFSHLGSLLYGNAVFGNVFKWSAFFVFFIPFTALFILSVSILMNVKIKSSSVRWISQYAATISMIVFLSSLGYLYFQFLSIHKETTSFHYENSSKDVKFALEQMTDDTYGVLQSSEAWFLVEKNDTTFFYGKPGFLLNSTESDSVSIHIQRKAHGRTSLIAAEHSHSIYYDVTSHDDTLFFSKHWLAVDDVWRAQTVFVSVEIPLGITLSISREFLMWFAPYLIQSKQEDNHFEWVQFLMTQNGLIQL